MSFLRFLIANKYFTHRRLNRLSVTTFAILISLISPLQIVATANSSTGTLAQAQTNQNRKIKADKLFQQGVELFHQSLYLEALTIFQQVLTIRRELDDNKART